MRGLVFSGILHSRPIPSLQTGSPYGLFRDLLSNSKGAGEREESLQWSLYDFCIYVQILNVNC